MTKNKILHKNDWVKALQAHITTIIWKWHKVICFCFGTRTKLTTLHLPGGYLCHWVTSPAPYSNLLRIYCSMIFINATVNNYLWQTLNKIHVKCWNVERQIGLEQKIVTSKTLSCIISNILGKQNLQVRRKLMVR